jgi:transketolase
MPGFDQKKLESLSRLLRYYSLVSTSAAGSGHPTSSMSAAELMAVLFFAGILHYDLKNPANPNNDRLIFSKGHASPLFYALYAAAGDITEDELKTLRKFGSRLEGHPTPAFPHTEAATGSLGQGLSIGAGMALNAKYLDKLPYKTFVLLGDSEMAEGSQWEAMEIAAFYKLDNLIGIIDVNALGQRGETMYGHDTSVYEERIKAFGWETFVVDGHDVKAVYDAYLKALNVKDKPAMIIAKTFKGRGVSFLENKEGWHGKALGPDDLKKALAELAPIDTKIRGEILMPENLQPVKAAGEKMPFPAYDKAKPVATRRAYGNALTRIFADYPNIVVLDAEVGNSTYAEIFKNKYPQHFFEMYIAEQNMTGMALGLARRGKIPFISTFSAFFSRAFDQIRMSQYSNSNIKFVGSHCGVSIGEDGSSQMGLEDIAMFRTLLGSVVLYPADAIAAEKLVEEAAKHVGNVYIRTTRKDTGIIYDENETFPIGECKIVRQNANDVVTVIGAGVTLYEALAAADQLAGENISVRVIDLYSIKPILADKLLAAIGNTKAVITVEDHFVAGGLGEAVKSALSEGIASAGAAEFRGPVHSLAVKKIPHSGKPEELMEYEEISKNAIVAQVKAILSGLKLK